MLYKFFSACYNMRVIKRNAQRFRLVTLNSSSFSPLSYMDRAQDRKALRLIHFLQIRPQRALPAAVGCAFLRKSAAGATALPVAVGCAFFRQSVSCAREFLSGKFSWQAGRSILRVFTRRGAAANIKGRPLSERIRKGASLFFIGSKLKLLPP